MITTENVGAPPERMVRRIAGTFATKFLAVALTLPVGVILARALGPAGRGEFVAAAAIAGIGMQFGNLGLHSANTYFVSRNRSLLGALSANAMVVAAVAGSVFAGAFYVARTLGGMFQDLDPLYVLLVLLWTPLGIAQLLQHNLIVGIQHVASFNRIELAGRVGTLLLCVALWLAGVTHAMPYVVASIAVVAVSLASCVWHIRRHIDGSAPPSLRLLREQLPYGSRMFLASLFAYLVVRSDVLLLSHLSGSLETGLYSIATSMVDMLYLLPVAVGLVLFPELAAAPGLEQQWRITKVALLHTGWLVGAGVVVLMLWGEPIIAMLFGHAYAPAFRVLVILAPAMLIYGLNSVISTFLAAAGLPWFAVWVWVVGFIINVSLNLLWIPREGGVGAARASLVAYAVVLLLQLGYAARMTAHPGRELPAGAQA